MQSTSCPWLRKLSHKWEPMKPAPPVTKYLAIVPSNRIVGEAKFAQIGRIIDIAPVENHRMHHEFFYTVKIRPAKLVPFRQNEQRRGAVEGIVIAVSVLDPVTEHFSRLFHRFRIERLHPRARAHERLDYGDRRCVAHIVSAR